jgi:hypothetical protein
MGRLTRLCPSPDIQAQPTARPRIKCSPGARPSPLIRLRRSPLSYATSTPNESTATAESPRPYRLAANRLQARLRIILGPVILSKARTARSAATSSRSAKCEVGTMPLTSAPDRGWRMGAQAARPPTCDRPVQALHARVQECSTSAGLRRAAAVRKLWWSIPAAAAGASETQYGRCTAIVVDNAASAAVSGYAAAGH